MAGRVAAPRRTDAHGRDSATRPERGRREWVMRRTDLRVGMMLSLLVACADASADQLSTGPSAPADGGSNARSLTVTPAEVQLEPGGSGLLEVAILDGGEPVAAGSASWASDAPAVASVDGSGLVTALSSGTAHVVATWRDVADTAAVRVLEAADGGDEGDGGDGGAGADDGEGEEDDGETGEGGDEQDGGGDDPPPPPGLVPECEAPAPEWIWCDDFEENRLAAYFEHEDRGGSFDRAAGVGLEGSAGMRASWSEGQVNAGWLHLAFGRTPSGYFAPVDAGAADHREVFWRFFVRYDPDWTGGGGSKMTRARIFHAEEGWVQAMAAPVWSGDPPHPDVVGLDPVSYTDAAGTLTGDPRWLGHRAGSEPIFADARVGSWYCIEAHVRLNDAGASNGAFRVWIDGALDAERTGLNWVGSYDAFGINVVTLDNHWNAGAPAAQSRYFDNLVVSTTRIGCG